MVNFKNACLVLGIVGAAAGCMAETDGDTSSISEEVSTCREIQHFGYTYAGSTFNWDVTTDLYNGSQFVDERRIGGGFYRQYRVSPVWSYCPHANESVTLRHPDITLVGSHNCLPDGRQEYHGSDYQRVLAKRSPFITYDCTP